MNWLNFLGHPFALVEGIYARWILPHLLRLSGRVELAPGAIFWGTPLFAISKHGRLRLGRSVLVNSRKSDYHTLMSAACFFRTNGQGVISIGEETRFHGSAITAYESVSIGKKCLIAAGTIIMDCGGHPTSFPDVEKRIEILLDGQPNIGRVAPVIIEDCVFIGASCIIMPGVRIGYGSVIAAGSVVVSDIPALCVAAGNPARIISRHAQPEARDHAVPPIS